MKLTPMIRKPAQKPLRSFMEFAEEFDITPAKLRGLLGAADAPKPELNHGRCAYYNASKFRAWFKGRAA